MFTSAFVLFIWMSVAYTENCCSKTDEAATKIEEAIGILQQTRLLLEKDNPIKPQSRLVGFHARLSHHVTVGSRKTVIFDSVITNIGKAYNPHTGHFTAPYDGMYYFVSSFIKTGSSPSLHLEMMHNSSGISKGYSASGGSGETGTMSAIVSLKKGDVVKVQHYPVGSNTQVIHGDWSYFTGYLIN